jgi:hypothetical protein
MRVAAFVYFIVLTGMLCLVLSGCGSTVVQERIVTRSVPVTVPCVSGPRPDPVLPLSATISAAEWAKLTPRQKAAHVAAQGLRHQSHGEAIEAATGACQ